MLWICNDEYALSFIITTVDLVFVIVVILNITIIVIFIVILYFLSTAWRLTDNPVLYTIHVFFFQSTPLCGDYPHSMHPLATSVYSLIFHSSLFA